VISEYSAQAQPASVRLLLQSRKADEGVGRGPGDRPTLRTMDFQFSTLSVKSFNKLLKRRSA